MLRQHDVNGWCDGKRGIFLKYAHWLFLFFLMKTMQRTYPMVLWHWEALQQVTCKGEEMVREWEMKWSLFRAGQPSTFHASLFLQLWSKTHIRIIRFPSWFFTFYSFFEPPSFSEESESWSCWGCWRMFSDMQYLNYELPKVEQECIHNWYGLHNTIFSEPSRVLSVSMDFQVHNLVRSQYFPRATSNHERAFSLPVMLEFLLRP